MSNSLQLKLDPEKIREMPLVDLAFAVLKAVNTPFYYLDLMKEVAKLRGLTEEEMKDTVAQLYTEINIDGRFACVGTNLWGLKRWYPVDRSEDPIASAKRPRIINDEDDDDDDDFTDEDDTFSADDSDEDFDRIDEDHDDIYSDDDSEEEVEEESILEDEELEDEEEDLDEEEEDSADETEED
ncbi:DNA-directed RNA polymerase subunit delta [Paenibacillus dokdonensis]|uniref:Probable DNA-directed RNA polymerase subunit delta n=1 Tax=Paenibacillus dokdonensis TaxID=2567944 RepID=A0ABU6GSG6_9BACL|nr:DNA-directed RNA polymerase subunit delta [Paenibacillus dokdonensis]MEC0242661.1 DNA-directed RNA polymerase subunit delta [Paenibacillus dokdonensis]